jgi:hypothetical protein
MCGRIIQSSGPLRYAIVDGMNARDARVHDYPPRWNGAPSQELFVIRRKRIGEVSLDRSAGASSRTGAPNRRAAIGRSTPGARRCASSRPFATPKGSHK